MKSSTKNGSPFGACRRAETASILVFIQHTAGSTGRSGVQRVVSELTRALAEIRDVACVKWDAVEGQLRFADATDLEALFGGPPPPGLSAPSSAWALGRRFGDLLQPDRRYCLIMPEIPFHLADGNEMLARIYSQCRDYRVEVASIFYDLIPITDDAYANDRARHRRYVAELCRHEHILAISRFSAVALTDYVADPAVAARVTAVPLPDLDRQIIRAASPRESAKRDTILVLGTVEPRKGQLAVLRAFRAASRASSALAGLKVVVIGSLHPAVAEELTALVAGDARIEYRGYCPDAEVRDLYDRALFTVFASRLEGFGLPITESLARGVPVICADFGAMAEVAEGGGCLTIDVRDETALGEALIHMAEDSSLRDRLRGEIDRRPFRTWNDYGRDIANTIEAAWRRAPDEAPAFVAPIAEPDFARLDSPSFDALIRADTLLFTDEAAIEPFLVEAERRNTAVLPPPRLLTIAEADSALAGRRAEIARQAQAAEAERACRLRLAALPAETRRPVLLRIVLSTYNRAAFVAANVEWLLRHVAPRHPDVEVVVVDNASTDDTEQRLARFAGSPGFHYRRNPANVGMLGNLAVCSTLPGAEYVWMIGDDDFIVPSQVGALCAALKRNFGVSLATTNFGVFHRETIGGLDDPSDLIAAAQPLCPTPSASGLITVAEAASQHDNLFTAIYPIIWRADIVAAAFNHPFDGPPFDTLTESIPSTDYILRTLGRAEIYWHAPVGVAGNLANSWSRHRPRWHSVLMPMALDLARDAGVDPVLLKTWAQRHRVLFEEALQLTEQAVWAPSEADRQIARRVLGLRLPAEKTP